MLWRHSLIFCQRINCKECKELFCKWKSPSLHIVTLHIDKKLAAIYENKCILVLKSFHVFLFQINKCWPEFCWIVIDNYYWLGWWLLIVNTLGRTDHFTFKLFRVEVFNLNKKSEIDKRLAFKAQVGETEFSLRKLILVWCY